MDLKLIIKIVAAFFMILGAVHEFLILIYKPHYLFIDGSEGLLNWSKLLGWIMSSLGVAVYLIIDFYDIFKRKKSQEKSQD